MAGPIISKLLTDFFNEIGHEQTLGHPRDSLLEPHQPFW